MFGAEEGMEPDDLLCPRNARSRKTLVGRAQWKNSGLDTYVTCVNPCTP